VFVLASDNPNTSLATNSDTDEAGDEVLANVSTTASVQDIEPPPGTAFAQSTSMAQAMNLTPDGEITYAPTVDTTVTRFGNASSTSPKSARSDTGGIAQARSRGDFELDGEITSGFLHGNFYLFGLFGGSASGTGEWFGGGFLRADIYDGYFVQAEWSQTQGAYLVNIVLPDITENFLAPSLNHYFTYTIPVTLPYTVSMQVEVLSGASARTGWIDGGDGTAQVDNLLSSSAWVTFTPTPEPPPVGDIDGDGDVDGDDFLALQRGFGAMNGATMTQGDVDHNGVVDGNDLALWEENYGDQLEAFHNVTLVPEPGALSLALMLGMTCLETVRRRGAYNF
jgi:hypothetical protein